MKKEALLAVFLLTAALAECGNAVCDQSDVVGCPQECIPTVRVFDWENLQGIGTMEQCGKGFGGIYYAFNSNCSDRIEVRYAGDFEVVQWSGIRHVNGIMQDRLCTGLCKETLVSSVNSTAAELGLWSDGMRRVNLFLRYQCQTVPTVRIAQVSATSVRVSADIYDPDSNTKQVNAVLIYPDFSRSSQTMGCPNNKCTSDYPVGGNGTYEILLETVDSLGPVYQYLSDSSCHFSRQNVKQDVTSSEKYRFRFNLTIDPCYGIECPDTCEGDTRKHAGYCSEGTCQYEEEVCADQCLDEVSYDDHACSAGSCILLDTKDCTSDAYCSLDTCLPKALEMGNCTQGFQCSTGWCSNEYCCQQNQTCCTSHSNCTNVTYCDPFSNHCLARADTGGQCESDSQCYGDNCYHNVCCPDGRVCCNSSDQCPLLQACTDNECGYNPLLYGVVILGLAGAGLAVMKVKPPTLPSLPKLGHTHRRVTPPKEPPQMRIPDELVDEMNKE